MPFVTDTHALIWHMTGDQKLSKIASDIFKNVDAAADYIFVPSIIFFEMVYLLDKNKIVVDFDDFLNKISSSSNYLVIDITFPILKCCRSIDRTAVKDPWDRLIAGTAVHLQLPLITCDDNIKKQGFKVIW